MKHKYLVFSQHSKTERDCLCYDKPQKKSKVIADFLKKWHMDKCDCNPLSFYVEEFKA